MQILDCAASNSNKLTGIYIGTHPLQNFIMSPDCKCSPKSSHTETFIEPVLSATLHDRTLCPSLVFVAFPENPACHNPINVSTHFFQQLPRSETEHTDFQRDEKTVQIFSSRPDILYICELPSFVHHVFFSAASICGDRDIFVQQTVVLDSRASRVGRTSLVWNDKKLVYDFSCDRRALFTTLIWSQIFTSPTSINLS